MPRLNPEFAIGRLEQKLRQLQEEKRHRRQLDAQVAGLQQQFNELDEKREVVSVNDMEFLWVGATTTLTWVAGFVRDKKDTVYPIPAGSRTGLTASTEYWAGWNPRHQTMSFATSLAALTAIANILIICRIQTGAGVNGNAGGGGREAGNDGRSGDTYQFV
jgi:hypothetical protein